MKLSDIAVTALRREIVSLQRQQTGCPECRDLPCRCADRLGGTGKPRAVVIAALAVQIAQLKLDLVRSNAS